MSVRRGCGWLLPPPRACLLMLWLTINGALFSYSYFRFHEESRYYYVRQIIGRGLCVSRGTASVLHLGVALVLLPVSRPLNLALARLTPRHLQLTAFLQAARLLHVGCALTIVLASVVHTISHVINAINFSNYYNSDYLESNWASYKGQSPVVLIFTSVVGVTGVLMLVILALMTLSSLPRVRSMHYNLFWYSHHLGLPLLLLYIAHPSSHVIKELANTEQHVPGCQGWNITSSVDAGDPELLLLCQTPVFVAPDNQAWAWVLVPLTLLVLDLVTRVLCAHRPVKVSCAAALPGAAIELFLSTQDKFLCVPGQYILLQCPAVSSLEWHPYTVIKCPNKKDSRFSIILRSRGDWSRAVSRQVLEAASARMHISLDRNPATLSSIRLYVNGPFASPLQKVIRCRRAVCVGAGVGITPFASVLRHLLDSAGADAAPERLHLIWLTPEPTQLLWLAWTMTALHTKYWNENKPDKFQFNVYLTRNYDPISIQKCVGTRYPLFVSRLHEGRPIWSRVFQQISNLYSSRESVHVFGCGSSKLMDTLERHCHRVNHLQNTNFHFVREAYS